MDFKQIFGVLYNAFSKAFAQGAKPRSDESTQLTEQLWEGEVALDFDQFPSAALPPRDFVQELASQGIRLAYNRTNQTMRVTFSRLSLFCRAGTDRQGKPAYYLFFDDLSTVAIMAVEKARYEVNGWGDPNIGTPMRRLFRNMSDVKALENGVEIYLGPTKDHRESFLATNGWGVYPSIPSAVKEALGLTEQPQAQAVTNVEHDDGFTDLLDEDPFA